MSPSVRTVRVLLVADTHIGFDLPVRPRIQRRRRGHDFVANFERALQPALDGKVDFVVHGGDLLHRSKLPTAVVEAALRPLVQAAEADVPVFVVPGNHERSQIPNLLLTAHPNLHVFNSPGTLRFSIGDTAGGRRRACEDRGGADRRRAGGAAGAIGTVSPATARPCASDHEHRPVGRESAY
jgi:DNA repair exonuclease SbcCD nuclease subunit